ncbi:DDE transposase family protein [Aerosakkonemataceae cyanobacterium BLCC-F154]|uniref:DDE transposase family protein n=1 Tax=Floridaenema fluviatile BLCC-F154 TaxID=3153640 RepID=A0ABV4YD68_9CYAN
MSDSPGWYIIKRNQGNCDIVPSPQVESQEDSNIVERWGPFSSVEDAIARRVGLIRAGKCKPI